MPRLAPPLELRPTVRLDPPANQQDRADITTRRLTLGDSIAQWETFLQSSDRIGSSRTITAYRYGTGKLVTRLGLGTPLAAVTPSDIEALLLDLKQGGMSPASRHAVYRPIKTFFAWCVKRGLLTAAPTATVEAPVVKVQPVEFVDEAEWQAILATCQTRSRWAFRPRRDLAILLVLGTTGARLSEVAGLRVHDLDLAAGSLLVHGKGGKDRLLPLLPEAAAALTTYLTLERPRSPYKDSPAVWLASKGPMTANGIAQMLADRGARAGVGRRVHCHELRHRFVSQTLAAGMPAPLVMALTGHSTPSMLNRYGAFNRSADAMAMWRELSANRATG